MRIVLKPVILATAIAVALPIMASAQDSTAPSSKPDQQLPATAAGQNAPSKKNSDQTQVMEGITVTGIAKSLEAALDTKRNADSFVDAINSEDVGKLPDANIAEVLQRVPGVAIQRTRGEGDFISIRGLGPNFVRGEVDGRTVVSGTETHEDIRNGGTDASTGRSTNFDVLPSEIVQRVEVYKSPTAAMVEGGIGGVVNIVTQNPLELGNHVFASANGQYRELNKAFNPDVSALASWRNDAKTFGILANLTYSKREIRDDYTDTYGWGTPANWAAYPDIDSTGSGTPNLLGTKNLSGPWTFHERQDIDTRERTTAQVKAAWKLADDSRLTANALYSRRTANDTALNSTWDIVPNGFVTIPPGLVLPGKSGISLLGNCGSAGAPAGGFCTVPGAVANGDSFTSVPVTGSVTDSVNQYDQTDSLTQLGLNYRKDFGAFHFDGDLSYSRGRGSLHLTGANVTTAYVTPYVVTNDGKKLQLQLVGNPDLSSAGNYFSRGLSESSRNNDQSETALALNGKLDLDNVPLSRQLEFGVRLAERDVSRKQYADPKGNSNAYLLNGFSGFYPESNFGGGEFSVPFSRQFFMTPSQLAAALQKLDPAANPPLVEQFQPGPSFEITEKANAVYIQDDLETELFGMPLKGNVGVRGVWTDESATGYFRPFTIVYDNANLGHLQYTSSDITSKDYKSSYFNLLPVLNLELDIRDDLLLRFAAGKSVTRPDFATQLAPSLNIINYGNNNGAQGGGRVAAGGNPDLKAYQSTNLDLGLEWYLAPSSALWAAAYHKSIDSFIAQSTSQNVERFGYTWNSFLAPDNQGSAIIHGLELGYQQVFENGFGFVLNGTLAGSSANYTHGTLAGKSIPFDGVSKKSYNVAVFYEKDGFNARLAYGYRSSYVLLGQDVFGNTLYNDGYGQLDASVSYALDDHWTVVADVVNLTNAANRVYTIKSFDSVAYEVVGRRIGFGVRAKF